MLTEENIKNRRLGVGASEAATVMGINKYMSAYQLWRIKTCIDPEPNLDDIPQVYWGSIHEDSIIKEYEKKTGQKIIRNTDTIFHKDYQFMLCHLDGKVEGKQKVLECKYAMFHRDDWGPNGSDIVPMNYIIQVQHQLAVTGYEEADLAVLIGGWDFRIYHFKRDEALIEKIISDVKEFWNCVENKTPPALSNREDVFLAYPENLGEFKQADLIILEVIENYKIIKQKCKKYESEKKMIEDTLTVFLKDSPGIIADDQVIATWKSNAKGSRVLRIVGA